MQSLNLVAIVRPSAFRTASFAGRSRGGFGVSLNFGGRDFFRTKPAVYLLPFLVGVNNPHQTTWTPRTTRALHWPTYRKREAVEGRFKACYVHARIVAVSISTGDGLIRASEPAVHVAHVSGRANPPSER